MSGDYVVLVVVFFCAALLVQWVLWSRTRSSLDRTQKELETTQNEFETIQEKLKRITERFRPVIELDSEVERVRATHSQIQKKMMDLRASYAEKKKTHEKLSKEVAIYDEQCAFAELGVYSPHFDFTDSGEFKKQINSVRDEQKAMVSAKTAIESFSTWKVKGSKREGQKMVNAAIRLRLRAFNNECEAALSNVRWNNVDMMEKRIQRAYEQINKLGDTLNISISQKYLDLKRKELWLTHEYREKQKEERDHKAEMKRLEREEKQLLREAGEAEKEEAKYQKLLDQAKKEAGKAVGVDAQQYEARLAELAQELEDARAKAVRAKSMAEQTRAGHIYVISNIGSFGEGVYKIGMTRRLDPVDRVLELGDASVPFLFDTHAMIYCEDAPTVEKKLHAVFDSHRVNRVNNRKEFFRVSLEDIEIELRKVAPDADIITGVEAQQYYETLAMTGVDHSQTGETPEQFPVNL